jgi:hypothetical protein
VAAVTGRESRPPWLLAGLTGFSDWDMEGHFAFQARTALPDTDGAGAAVAVELPARSRDAPMIVADAAAAAFVPMPMGPTSAGRDL